MGDDHIATDPRGLEVICSDERWDRILKKHPESSSIITFEMVQDAIENPGDGYIFSSKKHPDRHIYYRRIRTRNVELKVVVDFSDRRIGEIMTFHLCSNRPKGEEILWHAGM